MSKVPKKGRSQRVPQPGGAGEETPGMLRIIGGSHRGRKLVYSGDARTRPMKDRVREAAFNLLGPAVAGKHAVDLFAGTGALALEALSRGAAWATCFERHFPSAALIRDNAAQLGLQQQLEVVPGDTFIHFRRKVPLHEQPGSADAPPGALSSTRPWIVFVSPPWELFESRTDDMLTLLTTLLNAAPAESQFVVEADEHFDLATLPDLEAWDVREYLPAVVAVRRVLQR